MSDIIFEAVKLAVMIAAFVVGAYLLPFLRSKIGAEKLASLSEYAVKAVYAAQQLLPEHDGQERKTYVINLIDDFCTEHKITVSKEQINTLIEAAVKEMHISEGTKYTEESNADKPKGN